MNEEFPAYGGPFAFFKKHYNGDYSLARSYWVNNTLISWFAPLLGLLLLPWLAENFAARYASIGVLLITILGVLAWFWAVAGTWASASKHVLRGGAGFWANAAKVMIVLGCIKTFGDVAKISPMLMEHAQVATGHQLGPMVTLEVLADGKSIRLSGGINDGSAKQLSQALALAPAVKTVLLSSPGGWVREGVLLSKVIDSHELNTYVESHCASACTIAFLAGVSRAADPAAKIGFHSLSFLGGSKGVMTKDEGDATMAAYAKAGLPQAFIKKIVDTSADQMWYPTHEEMLIAGVFTRKSMGGESAALASLIKTYPALDLEFKKIPLYASIAEKQPDSYKRIVDSAWSMMEQGKSDADVMTAARTEITQMAVKLIPLASNETLVAYTGLLYEQIMYISKVDTNACVEMIFPSGTGISTSSFLSKELQKRELDLMYRVVNEADIARAVKVNAKQVEAAVGPLLQDLSDKELAAIGSKLARDKDLEVACSAAIKYLGALNRLPAATKGRTLRVIYSSD
jgi:hypothetical protein